MAIDLTLTGSGSVGHAAADGWSILESCTPAMPGDSRGSVGSASVRAQAKSDSRFVMDNDALVEHSTAGAFRGRVSEVSLDDLDVTFTVAGPAQFLNVDKVMPPVWWEDTSATPDFLIYGSGSGLVYSAGGFAVDPVDGSMFVFSAGGPGYKVMKFDSLGNFMVEFGSTGSADGQFNGLGFMAVSPVDQSLYVSDYSNTRVQKFTRTSATVYTFATKVGTSGTGNGQFLPTSILPIAIDSTGNVYVADRANLRIQKFTSGLVYSTKVAITPGSAIRSPYWLTVGPSDVVYVSSLPSTAAETPGVIEKYNTSLVLQSTLSLTAPTGTNGIGVIQVDSSGNIWAIWRGATFVSKYDSTGQTVLLRVQSLFPAPFNDNFFPIIALDTAGGIHAFYRTSDYYPYTGPAVTSFNFVPVTLHDATQTYMEACDATLNGWTLTWSASTNPDVVFPGWSGNVWANLKELFATYSVELTYDAATKVFTVYDIGSRTTTITNFGAGGVTTNPVNLTGGRIVDVIYQQPRAGGGVVWDAATENVPVSIAVGARDTKILYTVNHPAELAQPVPTDTLPIQPGQYYVIDSTGTAVPAATWLAAGGNIILAVGDSPGTIAATLYGPSAAITGFTGPFSFATGNTATSTPALSIVGNGTFCTPVTFPRAESQGQPFQSPFMDTLDRVLSRGHAPSAQAPNVTISFTCPVTELPAIGSAVGTVITYDGSKYRITDVRWGDLNAAVTAERYVTVADHVTRWSGQTIATIDTFWTGYSVGDQNVQPLRT